MTKTVKINDSLEAKIPLSWNDITIGQYLKLKNYKEHNDIEYLSIMLNVSKEDIENCENKDLDLDVYPHLAWYMKDSIVDVMVDAEKLERIKIGEKTISVPKDLMTKTFAQKILMEQLIEKHKDPYDAIADILAIYLFMEYYEGEKFNEQKVYEFRDKFIYDLSIVIGYPICSFFLRKLKESMSKKVNIWLENIPMMKKEQALINLKNLSI